MPSLSSIIISNDNISNDSSCISSVVNVDENVNVNRNEINLDDDGDDENENEVVHNNNSSYFTNWTVRDFYAWTRKHVCKTWYKNDQFKLRRAIGFWVS
jgi:hypothetical protein